MENQVDFKILPSDQFNVYSPQTRSEKVITYFTLLSKLRGDILAVSSQDDPNSIVSAYYTNVGNTQTLHLVKADGSEVTASNSFAGTVTSVDMSVPTGFAISGNPITTSGTLNVSFASGYSLPTNALQATWTTAYNRSITSAAVTGTSTKTLTLNQQDGGTVTASWTDQGLTSVGLTMPAAFNVANSPLTSNGTIAVTAAGLSSQYIRGDGQLANFPSGGGGGSAVNYYLNGSVNQGTFGGTTYYQMSRTPISGAGTNFTRTSAQGDGYVASFITDAGDPDLLNIPGGNWNLEFYFNSSSSGGAPAFYGDLYKVSASNVFTLISSGSTNAEIISGGTTVDQYYTSIAVPQTTLLSTDRLAIRVYVIVDGRNITLHTEDNNFSEVITTFSTGLNALNGLTDQVQYFATGTSGTDFNIVSLTDTHTFNIPTASGTNRGLLSSSDWTTFNNKASDSFKTIAVSGQSNVVADSATDTLTFEAGSNIVITTDAANDKITINALGGGSGSVTSVDMSVPTGFSISGNPITTSGTLALAFASGYSLPTNASQANWNTAYDNSITAFAYNTSTGVLTLTQQDAGTLTATVTLQPFTTDNLTQGSTNLYDKVVSLTGAGTTVVTGTYPNFTINSNDQHVGTVTSIATSAPITGGTITTSGTIGITQSGASADGYLSSTDWNTFNSKVGGSGTINYVSKWTSTGAIGNSQIFDSGTYVGINTATPAAKLDISGDHVASIGLLRLNSSASNIAAQTYYIDGVYKAATYAGTDDNFYILGRDADIVFSTTSSTTTRMVITNGGNVGIGTSGPTQKLMVSGSIRVTGGYYDSSNSIGSNGQVLASTGSGTTWINASGGTVNGSGTVNYLSKWTGTTLLGDSLVYDNGTNVGVGTTAPGQKVDVVGDAATDTYLRVLGGAGTTKGGIIVGNNDSGKNYGSLFFDNANNNVYLYQQYSSGDLVLGTNTNEKMRITSGGNVGIGNTGPSQKLHVEGNIRVTGAYYDSANGAGSSGQVLSSTGSGTSWITPFSGSGTTNYVAKWTSGTDIGNSSIYDNGNVGIGTTAPNTKLRIQESGTNPPLAIQNTNADGYSGAWLYNSAGTLVGHFGWGNGTTTALSDKMYFGSIASKDIVFTTSDTEKVRITSGGNVGIGTTNPSRLLHVAGNAQVDGWLFQGGYYNGSVTLPNPGSNYGNGRIYLRLCSSSSARIMTAKVRISSTWSWAAAFGSVEADISFYWDGSSLVYSYVNILSATGQAATNLTFGALEVEGGSISVPVYSSNSNTIYAYIQLSADADPSQVSYSTWSSVAFPGQANVYVQTSLGVGTTSPSAPFHVYKNVGAGDYVAYIQNTGGGNGLKIYNADWDTTDYLLYATNGGTAANGYAFVVDGNARVGIGNTAPSQPLHVSGNVRVTGAYYDSSNAAGTSGQILSSTGTGTAWISPGGGGGIITGSGTTNYVTKWTSGTAVGDSSIFDNGNVGIGTTSPLKKLVVTTGNNTNSSSNKSDALAYFGGGNDNPDAQNISFPNPSITDSSIPGMYWWSADVMFGRYKNEAFWSIKETHGGALGSSQRDIIRSYFYDSGGYSYIDKTVIPNGNVGIGTTSPTSKFYVEGGSANWNETTPGLSVGTIHLDPGTDTNDYGNAITFGASDAGSGANAQAGIYLRSDGNYGTKMYFATTDSYAVGSKTRMYIGHDGFVGIGITSPSYRLSINGDAGIEGSENYLYFHSSATVGSNARARMRAVGAGGGSGYGGDLRIDTRASNNVWNENVVTVSNNGNVGIGTTAPNSKLEVAGGIASTFGSTNGYVALQAGGSTVQGYIEWFKPNPTRVAYMGYNDGVSANNLGLTLENSANFVINGGNVGIGTTSPAGKLDVRAGSGGKIIFGSYDANYNVTIEGGDQLNFYNGASATTGYINYNGPGNILISRNLYVEGNSSGGTSGAVRITSAGNVGINETAPSQKLHVSGNIRVTGAYYDSANSAGTSGQILSSTGTGTAWIAAPSGGGVSGSGTTNYVAKWTSGSAVGDSSIYDNGNVGIGTTSPSCKLTVDSSAGFSWGFPSTAAAKIGTPGTGGSLLVMTPSLNASYESGLAVDGTYSSGKTVVNINAFGVYSGGSYSADMVFKTSTNTTLSEKMRITNDGNVGIGTTAPNAKLVVVGDGNGTAKIGGPGVAGNYTGFSLNGTLDVSSYNLLSSTTDTHLYINRPAGNDIYFRLANNDQVVIKASGKVGIGTTAPDAKLHVDGTVATNSALADVGAYRILKPNGGVRTTGNSSENGAIKITYPVGFTYTMHRVKVNVYEYTTNESFTIYFGGYTYAADLNWYNEFAYILSNSGTDRNFAVRFGYDGTNAVVYIGELGSSWTYPQIFIEEVELGYSGMSATWRDGAWGIGFETSAFQNVTRTVSDTQATNWARNGSSTYYGFGNVGIGTTAPTFKLDVRDGTNAIVRVLDTSTNNSLIMQAGTGAGMKITGYNYNTSTAVPLYISVDGANTIMQTGGGNVGIGTTAPSEKLVVNASSGANSIIYAATDTGQAGLKLLAGTGSTNRATRVDFLNGVASGTVPRWTLINDYNQNGTNDFRFVKDDQSTSVLTLLQGGNVGIGTTSPGYKLDVSGTIRATGDVIAYSDARVKENIETLDGALDKVMKMRGVSYNKIGEQEKKVGVIAQEILEVLPEVVSQDETGTYSVAYGNIVSVLIEAIKEQQKQIDELKAKLK